MEKTNLWNKLRLYRDKILVVTVLLLSASLSFAQRKTEVNLPKYDDRMLHYGFTLGLNSTRFRVVHSQLYVQGDTVLSATAPRSTGFSLGFVLNYRLADYFDLRLLPTVAFYNRTVDYELKHLPSIVKQISDATYIEFPVLVKYKSERRGNLRFYLLGGVKPGIEAGAKKKEKKETELRTQNYDFSLECGIGMDIYFPLFKFSPEIRFSQGMLNLLNNDPNVYSRSLNRLSSQTVSLYLHFE